MSLDIIVHPDFANFSYLNEQRDLYFQEISNIYAKSENLIFVNHKIRNHCICDFDNKLNDLSKKLSLNVNSDDLFYSKDPIVDGNQLIYGYISEEDFERFSLILNKFNGKEIRIHGCYYAQCTSNLALQVLGYYQLGRDLFSCFNKEMHMLDFTRAQSFEAKRIFEVEFSKVLDCLPIFYGTVFKSNTIHSSSFESSLPGFKSLDDQLSDSKTKVFG